MTGRSGLRQPNAALALLAAEGVQLELGVGGQPRGPRGVHGAARVVAMVQVPDVPDEVHRLARQPAPEELDRRLADAALREPCDGDNGALAAVLGVAVAGGLAERPRL